MHERFQEYLSHLEPAFSSLVNMTPVKFGTLPRDVPERGIYLFSEAGTHLYVGRTNRLKRRLAGHCRPSSNHSSATFAFRIARQETGILRATYSSEGSRASLVKDPVFGPVFAAAKNRVAMMDLRFVEEKDPVRQTLLEVYTAIALHTPYNDFDNH